MTRRLLVSYLLITAFALLVLELPLGLTFAGRERDALVADTERDARAVASLVEDTLETGTGLDPRAVAARYRDETGGRVVIVDTNGISVADSDNPTGPSRDFSTREEFVTALTGEAATGIRRSETLGDDLVYVAVPVSSSGVVSGAVRITYPTSELDARVRDNWIRLGLLSVFLLLAAALAGFVLARGVVRPLARLRGAAGEMATGDLSVRVPEDEGPPEVRELAQAFNDMAGRLDGLMSAQRAFVADASHQLRTPLTALRLRLDALESGTDDEHLRGEASAAAAETARLSRQVEGLLALARAEGRMPVRVDVDAGAVVRERVDTWAPLAEERGIALVTDGPGRAVVRVVDGALEQVLDNLLANALEVAPDGSTIDIVVGEADGWTEVVVADRGPGLDADHLTRIFDRFWRASDAPPGGSGLGLAIVAELARTSGGEPVARRRPGGGLEVGVRLRPA